VELGFRPLREADLALLSGWLSQGHVQDWWRDAPDLGSVREKYSPCIDRTDPTEVFIVEVDGEPVGMVQRYLLDDEPDWRRSLSPSGPHDHAAGIDYLLGDKSVTGRGVGPAMIGAFVRTTWSQCPQVSEVVVAVSQANRRSWRALEKAGFERVWAGHIDSEDPSDQGPSFVYTARRPGAS
jgi:aminoglycoside 6'-N-acetyltransferase